MMPSKLSDEKKARVVERYRAGEGSTTLGREYKVTASTILKYIRQAEENESQEIAPPEPAESGNAQEFASRARKILWREEPGSKEKKSYNRWHFLVKDLRKTGRLNHWQALVEASKEFPCLVELLTEFGIGSSRATSEGPPEENKIINEGKEKSHRENLTWAIKAAGKKLRIGEVPTRVPNDAAYYLYQQAINEPKDFLGKFTQIEARSDDELEKQRKARQSGKQSIENINEMLDILDAAGQTS